MFNYTYLMSNYPQLIAINTYLTINTYLLTNHTYLLIRMGPLDGDNLVW